MKKQQQSEQTFTPVKHFPRQPFGKHEAKYFIEVNVGRNYDGNHVPLSGCELVEQIDASGKDLLRRLGLARIDGAGRFEPDFPSVRAHLRTVCGWSDADVKNATWLTILDALRERERPQTEQGPDLTDDELQVLDILEERDTLTTNETIVKTLAQREIIRSDTTIKNLVRRLLDRGLIERPRERKGVRLTIAGKACLPEP